MEFIIIQMELHIKVNGLMIFNKVMEYKFGMMVQNIKDNSKTG